MDSTQDKDFIIKYTIKEPKRHEQWLQFFEQLKETKLAIASLEEKPPVELAKWKALLDKRALQEFEPREFVPDGKESRTYERLWELTKPSVRRKHPMFKTRSTWKFSLVMESLLEGKYELLRIEVEDQEAILFYKPNQLPFGKTEPLVQVIESFGNQVTYDYWHKGPHRRPVIGWNYSLARQLVAKHRGVEVDTPTDTGDKGKWWKFW